MLERVAVQRLVDRRPRLVDDVVEIQLRGDFLAALHRQLGIEAVVPGHQQDAEAGILLAKARQHVDAVLAAAEQNQRVVTAAALALMAGQHRVQLLALVLDVFLLPQRFVVVGTQLVVLVAQVAYAVRQRDVGHARGDHALAASLGDRAPEQAAHAGPDVLRDEVELAQVVEDLLVDILGHGAAPNERSRFRRTHASPSWRVGGTTRSCTRMWFWPNLRPSSASTAGWASGVSSSTWAYGSWVGLTQSA